MISFFSYLKIVEQEVMRDGEYDDVCKAAISRTIRYVETGAYAPGFNTAWICRRWRLTVKELKEEWKDMMAVEKSEAAFRSQICTLSKILYKLFPEEDFGEILSGDMAEGQIPRIIQTLDALGLDNIPFCTFFSEEINSKALMGYWEDYETDDLQDEIKLLREYREIMDKIMSIDINKLSYMKRVIDSKVADNPRKSEMLRALGLC